MRFPKATLPALPFLKRTVVLVVLLTLYVSVRLLGNATYGLSESRRNSQETMRYFLEAAGQSNLSRNESSAIRRLPSVLSLPPPQNSSKISAQPSMVANVQSSIPVFDVVPSAPAISTQGGQAPSGASNVSLTGCTRPCCPPRDPQLCL